MASIILSILLIAGVISMLGYYAYNNNLIPTKIQELVPHIIIERFPTGDEMTLGINPPAPRTQVLTNEIQPNGTGNSTNQTLNPDQTLIYTKAGQSYGRTEQFKKQLQEDVYQIGNPIIVSGTLKKVVPNSCKLVNGETTCEYIKPPIFDYMIEVTCSYRDACPLEDRINHGRTDGNGGFSYQFQTSDPPFTQGEYLIRISATSEVKDDLGIPYVLELEKKIQLVK